MSMSDRGNQSANHQQQEHETGHGGDPAPRAATDERVWRYNLELAFADFAAAKATGPREADWVVVARDSLASKDEQTCPVRDGASGRACGNLLVVAGTSPNKGVCVDHGVRSYWKTTKQYRAATREEHWAEHKTILAAGLRSGDSERKATWYGVGHAGVGARYIVVDTEVDLPDMPIEQNATKTRDGILVAGLGVFETAMRRVMAKAPADERVRLALEMVRDYTRPGKISFHSAYALLDGRDDRPAAMHNVGHADRLAFALCDEIDQMAGEGDADALYLQCHKRFNTGKVVATYAIDSCVYGLNHCMRLDGHCKYGKAASFGTVVDASDPALVAARGLPGVTAAMARALTPRLGGAASDAKARFLASMQTCSLSDPTIESWLGFSQETTLSQRMGGGNVRRSNTGQRALYDAEVPSAKEQKSAKDPDSSRKDLKTHAALWNLLQRHVCNGPVREREDRVQLQWRHAKGTGACTFFQGVSPFKLRRVREMLLSTKEAWPLGEVVAAVDTQGRFGLDMDDLPSDLSTSSQFWLRLHAFVMQRFDGNEHAATFGIVGYADDVELTRCHVVWCFTSLSLHEKQRLRLAVVEWLSAEYPGHDWATIVDANVTKMQCVGSSKAKDGRMKRLVLRKHVGVLVAGDGPGGGACVYDVGDASGFALITATQCFLQILGDESAEDRVRMLPATIALLPYVKAPRAETAGLAGAAAVPVADGSVARMIHAEVAARLEEGGCPRDHVFTVFNVVQLCHGVYTFDTTSKWCLLRAWTRAHAPPGHCVHDKLSDEHKSRRLHGVLKCGAKTVTLRCWDEHKEEAMLAVLPSADLTFPLFTPQTLAFAERVVRPNECVVALRRVLELATSHAVSMGHTGAALAAANEDEVLELMGEGGLVTMRITTTASTVCPVRLRAVVLGGDADDDGDGDDGGHCAVVIVDWVKMTIALTCDHATHRGDLSVQQSLVTEWPMDAALIAFGNARKMPSVDTLARKFPELRPRGVNAVYRDGGLFRRLVDDVSVSVHFGFKFDCAAVAEEQMAKLRSQTTRDVGVGCLTFPLEHVKRCGGCAAPMLTCTVKTSGVAIVRCECGSEKRFPIGDRHVVDALAPQSVPSALDRAVDDAVSMDLDDNGEGDAAADSEAPEERIERQEARCTASGLAMNRLVPKAFDRVTGKPTAIEGGHRRHCPPMTSVATRAPKRGTPGVYWHRERYLGHIQIPDAATTLVRSPPGSGKTTWQVERIVQALKDNPDTTMQYWTEAIARGDNFLVAVNQGLRDAGLPHRFVMYNDREKCPYGSWCDQQLLIISVNSASKLYMHGDGKAADNVRVPDMMIVDESESVIRAFAGALVVKDLAPIWLLFLTCVSKSKKVTMLDAFLGAATVSLADAMRPHETFSRHFAVNEYKVAAGRTITVASSMNDFRCRLYAALCPEGHDPLEGPAENVIVSCFARVSAEALHRAACKMFPNHVHEIGLFTGNTPADEKRNLSRHASTEWAKFRIFIHTYGAVGPGVDFSEKHFAWSFQDMSGCTEACARDFAQGCFRARNVPNMVIGGLCVSKGKAMVDLDTAGRWRTERGKLWGQLKEGLLWPVLFAFVQCLVAVERDETENNALGYFLGFVLPYGFAIEFAVEPNRFPSSGLAFAVAIDREDLHGFDLRYHTENHAMHRQQLGITPGVRLNKTFFDKFCNSAPKVILHRIAFVLGAELGTAEIAEATATSDLPYHRRGGRMLAALLEALGMNGLTDTRWHDGALLKDKEAWARVARANSALIHHFRHDFGALHSAGDGAAMECISKTLERFVGIELELDLVVADGEDEEQQQKKKPPSIVARFRFTPGPQGQLLWQFLCAFGCYRTPKATHVPEDMKGVDVTALEWFPAVYKRAALFGFEFFCAHPNTVSMRNMPNGTREHVKELAVAALGEAEVDARLALVQPVRMLGCEDDADDDDGVDSDENGSDDEDADGSGQGGRPVPLQGYRSKTRERKQRQIGKRTKLYEAAKGFEARAEVRRANHAHSVSYAATIPTEFCCVVSEFEHTLGNNNTVLCVELSVPGTDHTKRFRTTTRLQHTLKGDRPADSVLWVRRLLGEPRVMYASNGDRLRGQGEVALETEWRRRDGDGGDDEPLTHERGDGDGGDDESLLTQRQGDDDGGHDDSLAIVVSKKRQRLRRCVASSDSDDSYTSEPASPPRSKRRRRAGARRSRYMDVAAVESDGEAGDVHGVDSDSDSDDGDDDGDLDGFIANDDDDDDSDDDIDDADDAAPVYEFEGVMGNPRRLQTGTTADVTHMVAVGALLEGAVRMGLLDIETPAHVRTVSVVLDAACSTMVTCVEEVRPPARSACDAARVAELITMAGTAFDAAAMPDVLFRDGEGGGVRRRQTLDIDECRESRDALFAFVSKKGIRDAVASLFYAQASTSTEKDPLFAAACEVLEGIAHVAKDADDDNAVPLVFHLLGTLEWAESAKLYFPLMPGRDGERYIRV